jgi:aspartyl-tRNA(Asn)/glutamyl-tRNA(Gln) amidotransferase subunit A
VVGLKPTYGRVSRFGFNVLSNSLDNAGPLTRTVEDCALVMNVLAAYDPKDNSSLNVPTPDYSKALTGDIKRLRIGLAAEFFQLPLDEKVESAVREAIGVLEKMGATIREVSWPLLPYYETISSVILMAEASESYRKFVSKNGGDLYTPLRLRLEAGLFISAADYLRAQKARSLFNQQYMELFKEIDVLAGPTLPITAVPIGTEEVVLGDVSMGIIAALTQYTSAHNLTGAPAVTVPCGFAPNGMPIGLQLAGKPFDEKTVLGAAYAYERAVDWHEKIPGLMV